MKKFALCLLALFALCLPAQANPYPVPEDQNADEFTSVRRVGRAVARVAIRAHVGIRNFVARRFVRQVFAVRGGYSYGASYGGAYGTLAIDAGDYCDVPPPSLQALFRLRAGAGGCH